MSRMFIYLDLLSPAGSSDLPKSVTGRHIAFLPVLLRMGFTCAPSVTSWAVVSYTAFPPLPANAGGLFLLHFPWSHLHRTLSGILPYEARTFLTCGLSAPAAANICLRQKKVSHDTEHGHHVRPDTLPPVAQKAAFPPHSYTGYL